MSSQTINVTENVDVMCNIGDHGKCVEVGKLIDEALSKLSDVASIPKPKVLAVVTSGMSVLVLSAFEVLRKYDGVASIDINSNMASNVFQALHDVIELWVHKAVGGNPPRWVVEGLASALSLEALRRLNPPWFEEVWGELLSRGCVGFEELLEWRYPVDLGGSGVKVLKATGEGAVKAVEEVVKSLSSSLSLDLLAHIRGEDSKYYVTSALILYELGRFVGFNKLAKFEVSMDELKERAREVYGRVCGEVK